MSVGTAVGDVRRPAASASWGAARARSLAANPTALLVLGLTLLAAFIRFWRISHQGFWFDEGNTALLVKFSPGGMLGLLAKTESTPPLYYLLASAWAHVFGDTEASLRSLSALFGVATVPVAYAAGAKLISRRAGLIACALTACNPLLIWYSQEARAYEMLVFLSGLALLAFAYVREQPTPRRLACWVLVSVLALTTHYYAVLAIAPQAAWLLREGYRRRGVLISLAIVGLCGVALIPLAATQDKRGLTTWIGHAPLGPRVAQVWPQFTLGFGSPAWNVLKWIALAMAVLGLVLLLTRSAASERRTGLLLACLALAGVVLILLLVEAGVDDLITRNLLAIWMPSALAVAAGFAAPRPRALGLVAAGVLCATGLVAAVGVATNRNLERPDWRVVAHTLGPHPATPGADRAIFVQHYRDLLPLSLYLPGLKWMKRAGATVSEIDVVSFTSPPSKGFCWWGAACNLWPSRMQPVYRVRGFRELWRRRELQFTIMRLVSAHPERLTPGLFSRAVHSTGFGHDELLMQR